MSGSLIIGSMPIGNFDDITIRMLKHLESCDIIYSDTPTNKIKQILDIHKINKEVIGLKSTDSRFADQDQLSDVIKLIEQGKEVMLVSEEGQVSVSDPGQQFIRLCIDNNLNHTVLPGPNSHITAIVHSGLVENDFFVSSSLNDQTGIVRSFAHRNEACVMAVWAKDIFNILQMINDLYVYDEGYKEITILGDMTMESEFKIVDRMDKILANPNLFKIENKKEPFTKIIVVISNKLI
jgi:16S rRNA (cytidine1402-2'-O)-methyltransferase